MKEIEVYRDEGEVDISVIENFEKKIGYKLPLEYKKLLSKHNGLYPENNDFIFLEDKEEKEKAPIKYSSGGVVFLAFYEYPELGPSYSNIENYQDRYVDHPLPPHTIVFGDRGGDDMIAFDYRDNPTGDNPKIILLYHDWFDEDETEFAGGYYKAKLISNSFEEFMDSLFKEDEVEYE
jgi:cell wall assembly regulator SMI1